MSYALSVGPTPLRKFLGAEPYMFEDTSSEDELSTVTKRTDQAWHHYYDQVTITRQNQIVEEEFRALADEWIEATRFLSSISQTTAHPAYRAIVDLGQQVVPLLLRELETRPNFWFTALREITGVNPVQEKDRGHIDKMARAWLQWGRGQGITW